jgi:hypothetical protein
MSTLLKLILWLVVLSGLYVGIIKAYSAVGFAGFLIAFLTIFSAYFFALIYYKLRGENIA